MIKKGLSLLLCYTAIGCASSPAVDRDLEEAMSKASNAYADCGFYVAEKHARSNFLPQDIADAALAECAPEMTTYKQTHYKYMISQTSGSIRAKSMILDRMPAFIASKEEAMRKAVIAHVLEVRSSK